VEGVKAEDDHNGIKAVLSSSIAAV
jgi:hypothetical protein